MVEFTEWMERFIEDTKQASCDAETELDEHYFSGALFAMERALEEFHAIQGRKAMAYFRAEEARRNEPGCPF